MGLPDVCKVPAPPAPPIPMPFPNMGQVANATKTSTKVFVENKALVVETSEIPSSTGDQAGSGGGLISGTVGDKIVFRLGSTTVIAEGKGVAYQTGLTAHNGANANMPAGLHDSPSQTKVLVMP
ncbi:MAG: DUF4150 domain-containing protein [Myxococcales bacterium]|nr:DUF4150 domain-containing protein [Myxococcales bacterium]